MYINFIAEKIILIIIIVIDDIHCLVARKVCDPASLRLSSNHEEKHNAEHRESDPNFYHPTFGIGTLWGNQLHKAVNSMIIIHIISILLAANSIF